VRLSSLKALMAESLRHRISLSYEAHAEGVRVDQAIDTVVERVAVA
jgi:MoxR-like ATPase